MTTIKQYTDSVIYSSTGSIELKMIKAKAATEHMSTITNSLAADRETIKQLNVVLGNVSDDDYWGYLPTTNVEASAEVLHTSYLNLLGRCLLRSDSPERSEALRKRFALPSYIVTGKVSDAVLKDMRTKYVNLLEIHGEVKAPNLWERILHYCKNMFNSNKDTQLSTN